MKNNKFFFFFIFIYFFNVYAYSNERLFAADDVYGTIEHILTLHVEHNKVSQDIIRRSFKIYINMFDKNGLYLCEDEVDAFLNKYSQRNTLIVV